MTNLAPDLPADFVIVTALPEELQAVLGKLPGCRQLPPNQEDIRIYYQASLPVSFPDGTGGTYRVVVMCLTGMGRVQASIATSDAIRRWRPRYILLVGIAGGMGGKVRLGDVLISDQVVDYEQQKVTGPEQTQIRWEVQRADARLLNACHNLSAAGHNQDWQALVQVRRSGAGRPAVHTGPIASGDKVIAFDQVLQEYQAMWPKLIGVEMEAGGVASAAFQAPSRPGFFMVRGVADLADKAKGSAAVEKWRAYACDVAAAFTIALLQSGPAPLINDAPGSTTANNQPDQTGETQRMNCPHCQTPLETKDRFCPGCGRPVGAGGVAGGTYITNSQGIVIGSGNTVNINNNPPQPVQPGAAQPASAGEQRKQDLLEHCLRQYRLLHDYERVRDLSSDPKETARARQEIATIQASLRSYLDEYRQLSGLSSDDLPGKLRAIQVELDLDQPAQPPAQAFPPARPEAQQTGRQDPARFAPGATIRILYLAANPTTVYLHIDEEVRRIQAKLQLARMRDQFKFEVRLAVRPDDLTQALLDFEPHIVHFSGHGAQDGSLMLADEQGAALPVTPETLGALFQLVSNQVGCVLLNACYSESQARAIADHIPFVIGMSQEVTDQAALAFSVGFYQALGAGRTIEDAYQFGVVQIRFQGTPEHLIPVLVRSPL